MSENVKCDKYSGCSIFEIKFILLFYTLQLVLSLLLSGMHKGTIYLQRYKSTEDNIAPKPTELTVLDISIASDVGSIRSPMLTFHG